jgi:hypothetical protein
VKQHGNQNKKMSGIFSPTVANYVSKTNTDSEHSEEKKLKTFGTTGDLLDAIPLDRLFLRLLLVICP